METIDYVIVGGYLLGLVLIGGLLAKKAGQGSDEYFLGGRRMPWWALGASGMSSNLDVAGTIVIISFIYTYGLQGFFIEMRGGVVLPIAIWLAFMGKWHRRSGVTTTAEWMELRFGRGTQGRLARYTAAFTYLIITVGMVTFFLVASGKFLADFVPDRFDVPTSVEMAQVSQEIGQLQGSELAADTHRLGQLESQYAQMQEARQSAVVWLSVGMAVVALVYTMVSGLYGVVWTDVFQAFLIGAAAVYISVQAFNLVSPELLASWPGHVNGLNVPWPVLHIPAPEADIGGEDPYAIFWVFLLFFAGKGILEGLGGSGGSAYMAQRYYASATDKDTYKLSMLWALLFAFRWPMVLGFAIIAIHLGIGQQDPERILSGVLLSDYFPAGLRGLAIAAVFAASMSTFDSTINAGASYVVKDLWVPLRSGRADAVDQPGPGNAAGVSERSQVVVGYLASAGIVAVGLAIALSLPQGNVTYVWTKIVVQLFPAFLMPFALRWFWGRLNGSGFCVGILFGFLGSLLVTVVDTGLNEWQTIGFVAGVSLVGCFIGTYAAKAVAEETARAFYLRVRPFGLWPAAWKTADTTEHTSDKVRLVAALLWQTTTFLLPMLLILKSWGYVAGVGLLWLVLTLYLLWDIRRQPDTDTDTDVQTPAKDVHTASAGH